MVIDVKEFGIIWIIYDLTIQKEDFEYQDVDNMQRKAMILTIPEEGFGIQDIFNKQLIIALNW